MTYLIPILVFAGLWLLTVASDDFREMWRDIGRAMWKATKGAAKGKKKE